MASEYVKLERKDALAIITLERPEARNALSPDMLRELSAALQRCGRPEVRAVLLTGTGNAFCAGADVKDLVQVLEVQGPQRLSQHLRELAHLLHREVILGIRRLDKPVVAGVNGVAAGAGFSLALACDLRWAAHSARFLMAYANIGAAADGGSTFLLPRLVGQGKALEVYTASQPISAEYACDIGLVNQVIPAETFERHSLELATRLSQGPTRSYGSVKALFDQGWGTNLEGQLNAEAEAMAAIALTRDFQEGIRAFVQKRQPWFQGM
jgi:2-(1,2-epoxy-1,2-dihydrophenyl)acetyl-CoA isomerase